MDFYWQNMHNLLHEQGICQRHLDSQSVKYKVVPTKNTDFLNTNKLH